MKLSDMVSNMTIQGNIRISVWAKDLAGFENERVLFEQKNVDSLSWSDLDEKWEDWEVNYLFTPGDGYLHIELTEED